MATKYCDHGIYAAPVAGGTVPTAAEDGNGKAKTAATMATLVIVFSGLPSADQAITIAGVTFTAKASGAAGNQFNIGADAATTATNLKTAINASTTNAVKPVGVIAAVAPLRNVVNATSSGGTVTIYTRCAGSEWNSVTENSTLANCTVTQWSGGADGAWGYFTNTASLWPTGVAVAGYGVFSASMPYLGLIAAGDVIKVRSAKTLSITLGGDWSTVSLAAGTLAAPVIVQIDDSTEWDDGANPVFAITAAISADRVITSSAAHYFSLLAKRYAAATYGFTLTTTGAYKLNLCLGTSREYAGCRFTSAGQCVVFMQGAASEVEAVVVRECKFQSPSNTPYIFNGYNNTYGSVTFAETVFDNTGNTVANSGIFAIGGVYPRQYIYLDSCSFTNFVWDSQLFQTGSDSRNNGFGVFLRNCDFGNVSKLGPNTGLGASPSRTVAASSQFGTRDFFVDTMFGYVEWQSNLEFPTCNARQLDGITPWSIHIVPTTTAGRNSRFQFVETPRIGKIMPAAVDLSEAVRDLTIEMLIINGVSWNKSHVSVVIDYMDTSGVRQVIDTYDYAGGALTASEATWSKYTFSKSGATTYDRYKFAVTTPTAVAAETEVGIVLRCHTYVANTTQGCFIDPEIQVV